MTQHGTGPLGWNLPAGLTLTADTTLDTLRHEPPPTARTTQTRADYVRNLCDAYNLEPHALGELTDPRDIATPGW
jgi:hypothetical protein